MAVIKGIATSNSGISPGIEVPNRLKEGASYGGSKGMELVKGSREGEHIVIRIPVGSPTKYGCLLRSNIYGLNMIPLVPFRCKDRFRQRLMDMLL